MNTRNEVITQVNHLRVINENIHFKWQVVGFNDIPFLNDNPVSSPTFSFLEDSNWQMLMDKVLLPEESDNNSSIFHDVESGIDTHDNELDLTQDEIRSEHLSEDREVESEHPSEDSEVESEHLSEDREVESEHPSEDSEVESEHPSEDSEVENEHSSEDSEVENKDTIEDSSDNDDIKPLKKVNVKSTASQAILSVEEIKPVKKCDVKSTASQVNLSDEAIKPLNKSNLELKTLQVDLKESKDTQSDWESLISSGGLKTQKIDLEESRDSESDRESLISSGGLKRALGFKIVKTENNCPWEVIKYHLQLTIGGLKKIVKPKSIRGLSKGDPVDYLYVYESDIGLNLDYVKAISIEAFIEYTFLDCNPLEPQTVDSEKIYEDLNKLWESQNYSDIILVAGTTKIPAHKCILSARAYAFDAMLQENPKLFETCLSLNLEKTVAMAMVSFIYSGGIPSEFPLEKCKALCKAADEYQVNGLKEVVNKFFINNLDPDVCLQCLGIDQSGLDTIDISEDQIKNVLQKEICLHKYEIE